MVDATRRWKVGELAEATGLTVRTLHHFDDLGLLRPSERSPGGHRLYTDRDVRRLYQVLALRQLGVPLAEIKSSLDGDLSDVPTVAHILGRDRRRVPCAPRRGNGSGRS